MYTGRSQYDRVLRDELLVTVVTPPTEEILARHLDELLGM
jgi:hypothetical protein